MARTKRFITERFLKDFEGDRPAYEEASKQAETLIKEILVNSPALIHVTTSRCKELSSLRLKLAGKKCSRPRQQITDLIASRVIVYYQDAVPIVVKALSDALEINPYKSIDKRKELEAVEFGYTSVHLIARTRGAWSTSPKYFQLRNKWFEIQVRSVLEHAWAEIEHEVVYKSGIQYPPLIKRRFARIAGAIEILEDEFIALRDHQQELIEHYKIRYEKGQDGAVPIDAARMIALLECERPNSTGWRFAAKNNQPFPPHIDNRCVKALKRAGIRTGQALRTALRSKELKAAERLFKSEHRIAEPLSHLVTARLVILLKSPIVFSDYFPEQASDPAIQRLIRERRKRK
jgi:ppGpp synthetase/RelA/SpoT-type nucleotidyltranferase